MTYTTYIKDDITNQTLCVRTDTSIVVLFKYLKTLPEHYSSFSVCDDKSRSIIRWSDILYKRIDKILKENNLI